MSLFLKRWWWALLLVAVAPGSGALRFDVDVLNLLPPDEPTVQGLKLYQQHFANARELVITLRAPDAEQAERLAGAAGGPLAAGDQPRGRASPGSRPGWRTRRRWPNCSACLWLNQPPEDFAALTNRLAPDRLKPLLAQTKEVLATSMSPMDMARRAFDPFDLLNMPGMTNFSAFSAGPGAADVRLRGGELPLVVSCKRPLTWPATAPVRAG